MIDDWILGYPILGQIHQIFHGWRRPIWSRIPPGAVVAWSYSCQHPFFRSRQPVTALFSWGPPIHNQWSSFRQTNGFKSFATWPKKRNTWRSISAEITSGFGMLWFQRRVLGNGAMQLHIFCRSLRIETKSGNSLEPWPEAKWAPLCA